MQGSYRLALWSMLMFWSFVSIIHWSSTGQKIIAINQIIQRTWLLNPLKQNIIQPQFSQKWPNNSWVYVGRLRYYISPEWLIGLWWNLSDSGVRVPYIVPCSSTFLSETNLTFRNYFVVIWVFFCCSGSEMTMYIHINWSPSHTVLLQIDFVNRV